MNFAKFLRTPFFYRTHLVAAPGEKVHEGCSSVFNDDFEKVFTHWMQIHIQESRKHLGYRTLQK